MRLLASVCVLLALCGLAAAAKTKLVEFTCIRTPLLFGPESQTVHVECGAVLNKGQAGLATWSWQDNIADDTRLLSTTLEVLPIPSFLGEGEERISLKATFQRDELPVPTCQTRRRLTLEFENFADPEIVRVEMAKGEITDPNYQGRPYSVSSEFDEWQEEDAELLAWESEAKECPHREPPNNGRYPYAEAKANAKADTKESGVAVSALPAQTPNRKTATPEGLNVLVKCKSAPSGAPSNGRCSVNLRLALTFSGGLNVADTFQQRLDAEKALQSTGDYQCALQTYFDEFNVLSTLELNGGEGKIVNPQLCRPPQPTTGRKLQQVEPAQAQPAQSGSPTIPAGSVWDDSAVAKTVRAARYASALHGCLPGRVIQGITPATLRTWDDVQGWGNSGDRCRSCSQMQGINYGAGLGGPPVGWETPNFAIGRTDSFRDAAMVFTDTSGVLDANPAIVVVFRATVTSISATQWLSNIGYCVLGSFGLALGNAVVPQVNVYPPVPGAGNVCSGWLDPITAFNNGNNGNLNTGTQNGPQTGLFQTVLNRIQALRPNPASQDTPTRIFVFGHSRGGALAAAFAGYLLARQSQNDLGNYVGPFGRRGQISLYTLGAPNVGNSEFAAYLERGMYERWRLINRNDPVVTAPRRDQGYFAWRPSVWYQQSDAQPSGFFNFRRFCVLTPFAQIPVPERECFVDCSQALVCAYNEAVPAANPAAGNPVPTSPACQVIADSTETGGASRTALGIAGSVRDHATYVGISVENSDAPYDCRSTISVYSEGCIACSDRAAAQCPAPNTFVPFTPPPLPQP